MPAYTFNLNLFQDGSLRPLVFKSGEKIYFKNIFTTIFFLKTSCKRERAKSRTSITG